MFMRNWDEQDETGSSVCTADADLEDARRVGTHLGIPVETVSCRIPEHETTVRQVDSSALSSHARAHVRFINHFGHDPVVVLGSHLSHDDGSTGLSGDLVCLDAGRCVPCIHASPASPNQLHLMCRTGGFFSGILEPSLRAVSRGVCTGE